MVASSLAVAGLGVTPCGGVPLTVPMFVLEFAVRCRVLPPEERSTLKSGWEAWQRYNARQRAAGASDQPPAS